MGRATLFTECCKKYYKSVAICMRAGYNETGINYIKFYTKYYNHFKEAKIMKKFNQMTEKSMSKVKGGELVVLILNLLALVVTPLALGGAVGYGAYEGTKNNK